MTGGMIIVLIIAGAIIIKTKSVSKAAGFLVRYFLFPILFCVLFGLFSKLFLGDAYFRPCALLGAVVGVILAFMNARKKLKNEKKDGGE